MPPPLLDELSPIHSRPPLSRVSRYTARFHLPAAAFDGLVAGAFTLSDVVLRKTFGASALLITLMVMAQPVSQLLAIVWGRLMHGRSKRPFILGFGGIGRLSLILVAFAGTAVTFAVPIVVSIALAVAIIPALNALYQSNYPNSERGRVFGQVLSMTAVATIASSMAAGWWMDHDAGAYRIIYPLTGIIGLAGIYLYWRIRPRAGLPADDSSDQKEDLSASDWFEAVYDAVRHPFRGAKTIFTTDPNFLRFEIGYMLYGLGFMMLQPVLPLYLVDEIHVQYSEAAIARGLIFWGMMAIVSPIFGRLLDRWNAVRLSIFGFAFLMVVPLLLAISHSLPGVYLAFAVFGFAMSPVNIAWTMGPILFAGRRDAATYMGVHVTMVGIRGLIGNPMGLILFKTFGSRPTFLVASLFFALAMVVMIRLNRRLTRDGRPA
ncbi:MAG: MFS transporter [Candidatus Eisenbacteria bacterium]|nr:MFS transporter [Candidatus Eisenbacteria bacterium]